MKNKYHNWTKEEIKTVIELWENTTIGDLAEKLGVSVSQIHVLRARLNEAGVKLSRKRVRHCVGTLIKEMLEDGELKKGKYGDI